MIQFLLLLLLVCQVGFAQMLDKSISFENPEGAKLSSQELTEQALRQMSEELVVDFVGVETYTKNKVSLTKTVIAQANKFTPFQKVISLERGDFGARMTVQFKVSLNDFRKLLSDAGVFSKKRLALDVISFFSIENEDQERLASSWVDMNVSSGGVALNLWNDEFKTAFEKAGFNYNKNLNPAWIATFKPNSNYQDVLNRNTNTQSLILWGTAKLTRSPKTNELVVIAQVKVFSQELKKEVTDSIRKFSVKDQWQQRWATWAQELIQQIDEVDARSLIQGSSLIMTLKGPLSLSDQDFAKSWLLNSSSLIKSATERRFAKDRVSFEVETSASLDEIAKKFASLDFKGYKLKTSKSSNEITMEILP